MPAKRDNTPHDCKRDPNLRGSICSTSCRALRREDGAVQPPPVPPARHRGRRTGCPSGRPRGPPRARGSTSRAAARTAVRNRAARDLRDPRTSGHRAPSSSRSRPSRLPVIARTVSPSARFAVGNSTPRTEALARRRPSTRTPRRPFPAALPGGADGSHRVPTEASPSTPNPSPRLISCQTIDAMGKVTVAPDVRNERTPPGNLLNNMSHQCRSDGLTSPDPAPQPDGGRSSLAHRRDSTRPTGPTRSNQSTAGSAVTCGVISRAAPGPAEDSASRGASAPPRRRQAGGKRARPSQGNDFTPAKSSPGARTRTHATER